MMTFILWFIRFLVLVVAVAMVRMAFVYWYRRNSTSPLAVLLREKLFFLPSGFWPTPLVDDGPTLTELIEEQDEELDPERQLLKAEKGHSFVFNFVSQTVVGRVSTQRMEQEVQRNNYPWHDVPGERNQFVFVDGNQAFAYYPFGERGRPVWFFLEPEDASGLWEYFKGSDTEPGPARKFGASRQLGTVTFTLFGKTWKMKDIGMNSFPSILLSIHL